MIPKALLIHNAVIYRTIKQDRDRNPLEVEEIQLKNVRIVPTLGETKTNVGNTKADTMTLFYDPITSSSEPAGYIPKVADRLAWGGNTFTIQSVAPQFTRLIDKVHHYEAALV